MLKIIFPIIIFILIIYGIMHYWEKANTIGKKKIASSIGIFLIVTLSLTFYLLID
ncbi:MAG: hypothetical protein ACJZ4O_00300 [Pelagibacteraceae bacterium]